MMSIATHMVLQIALLGASGAPIQTYRDAYYQAERQQKPLLVLVGDESSTEYRKIKTEFLPALARDGVLKEVAVAVVDLEKHRDIARKIMQDGPAPQLVLYLRNGDTWLRSQLSTPESVTEVREFLKNNVETAASPAVDVNYSVPVQWGSS